MSTAKIYTTDDMHTLKPGRKLTDYEVALLIPWFADDLAGLPLRELPPDEFEACMRIFARFAGPAS